MAAVEVHQFAQCITCHAWSADRSMIALCPNNNEVHIYRLSQDKWEKVHVLQKHDQIVCGIDWSARSNRIVTASHDRNSYVWNQEGSEWVPTLVILRLNRAALCVQWSPKENKFAVGSGAKTVCICYYEQDNNWWVSKLIRKRHDSSVTSVAWHPNNILLATTSTDGKCRVFSTFIKGVDTRDSKAGSVSDSKFGEQIVQLDLSFSWAFGVKWSPSGNTLAYVGHNSMIYFVDDVGPSPLAQNVAFRDLPLRDVLFVSEKMVIGVGFDCNPMVFAADERGIWSFIRFLGERKSTLSGSRYSSQFSEAFGKFYGQSKSGASNDGIEPSRSRGGIHENCISCIMSLTESGSSRKTRFSTSGLDGKVVVWDLENQEDLSGYL
ncbi:PREDICTED: actin-related protein 2/3 complex subunit 1A-like isoform X1 [Populus euphratica]|uniref:Actin-related protein 2/3 complex subunit n=1 Tax=Populus euphratica TaxID=75702 RepID=A0AAJ6UPE2_POPEU|nr:PREDICTED: actin-related protein 2/3 complex subunit 1A-like isoform X1 [Populus euphratica]